MAEFYHDLITEKSFKRLQDLRREFDFILIGGWAVFLYTKSLKSKDIDIIIDYDQLEKIKEKYDVFKNERLNKYEIKLEETDVDIYLPYFSKLGLKVEEVQNHCQNLAGFLVPTPEILLILKAYAFQERKGTNKGRKDLLDIFSLLKTGQIDWLAYRKLIKKYDLGELNEELKSFISSQKAIAELNLLDHRIAKLKKETLKNL